MLGARQVQCIGEIHVKFCLQLFSKFCFECHTYAAHSDSVAYVIISVSKKERTIGLYAQVEPHLVSLVRAFKNQDALTFLNSQGCPVYTPTILIEPYVVN